MNIHKVTCLFNILQTKVNNFSWLLLIMPTFIETSNTIVDT